MSGNQIGYLADEGSPCRDHHATFCEEDWMPEAMSIAEIRGQKPELLPARILLSLYSGGVGQDGAAGADGKDDTHGTASHGADGRHASVTVENKVNVGSTGQSNVDVGGGGGPGLPDEVNRWLCALKSWLGVR